MELPYYDFSLSNARNSPAQDTMGPPPSPRPAATQHQSGYVQQNHLPRYIRSDVPPAPDHYAGLAGHMWHSPGDAFSVHPPPPRVGFAGTAARSDPPVRQSMHTQNASGRTTTICAAEWIKYKTIIHKLWIEEDRALQEMKVIMSDKYHFHAS
jgi:hypothetical protein